MNTKGNELKKGLIGLLVLVLSIFDPMAAVTGNNGIGTGMTVSAATVYTYTYYPKYTGSSSSFVTALNAVGVSSSYSNRKVIAANNGITSYSGTASQNKKLLNLLKTGKLVKTKTALDWEISMDSTLNITSGVAATATIRFKGTGISSFNGQITNSSKLSSCYFSNTTWKSAGNWCSTTLNITGKSAGTCVLTFKLNGTTTMTATMTVTINDLKTSLVSTNLSKVTFQKQSTSTCKATSLAMAINLIRGTNSYTTKSLGGATCTNVNKKTYIGSNGSVYVATYKNDSYVGSKSELTNAINIAVSAGLPIVVSVHSNKKNGTQHHYVVVVGKTSSGDYQIVDPAYGTSGCKLSSSVTTMSSRNYSLGLADYGSSIHYSYISFAKK
ncbi:MAG: hypothetical protein LUI87_16990 [Lachnospiraceae bacterium]|nr:hypothetical protein [Lachnospiraceae bacterium]